MIAFGVVHGASSPEDVSGAAACGFGTEPSDLACAAAKKQGDRGLGMVQMKTSVGSASGSSGHKHGVQP